MQELSAASTVGWETVEFRVLGPLEVRDQGRALPLGGAKQRAVLAVLLLHPNEVLSSDRLIEELWGERPPDTAGKALQGYVSALRKLLEPERGRGEPNRVLLTRPPGYLLQIEPEQLDLTRFEQLRAEAREALAGGDPAAARARLEESLSLWRGQPLADFSYERFAQSEIGRLEGLRLAAFEERIEADLVLGRHAELVGELEALIAEHPLRERFRAQLMLSLYRSGRQAEALEAYRQIRRALVEELGIEPGRELKELERAILTQDPSLDVEPPSPAATTRGEPAAEVTFAPAGRRPERHDGSFVGRDPEIGELLDGLDAAFEGKANLFLVAGEPGIGKSRLADEITARARAQGAKVFWGRCWEAGGAPAYWPWVQALRAYIRESERDRVRAQLGSGATDVAQMLPELHDLFPDLPTPPSLDPEGARFRLFDSTASFLRAAGAANPLLLVIDDLHAADTSSLLLLRFLARELREARVMLVAAYRDTEARPDDALSETLVELRREPTTRLLRIGGLAVPEVARFIELIVGTSPRAEMAAAIHRETEGNPLFVGELVRLLASEGRLEEAGGRAWSLSVPQGVREVIGHRLRHLSEECKRLLSVASILGRDFRLDVLEEVSERSGDELLDLLDEAVAARVIEEPSGRGGLRFSHALIRDSLYGELGRKERQGLHRRTAEVLEALYARDRRPHLAELAHHFLEAAPADPGRGIDYACRAGDHAAAVLAYEEAARLYRMALEALERKLSPDESVRCDVLLALGDAQARGGDVPSAKETFLRAAEVAKGLDDAERLARAALGYGGRFIWFRAGEDEQLIPLLEDALEVQAAGDNKLRAMLLARLAGALRDRPVPERRTALTREAVSISRRLGDRTTLAYALEGTYAALTWPKEVDAWLATVEELTRLAEDAGDREQAFAGHVHAFGSRMLQGDLEAVKGELRVMSALAEELRQPAQRWALAIARGMVALFEGRLEDADREMQEAAEFGSGGQGLDATFYFVTNLQGWALRRAQGRLVEIEASVESFVDEYPTFSMLRSVLANLYADLGRRAQAREQLDRLAADDFAELHLGTEWFFGASLLAEVCASLEDTARARLLYEKMLPFATYNVFSNPEVSLGSASRYLGILATTMSRWEEAARHFEYAIEMNARMGARPWVAHTQQDYARMRSARDRPGDRERALELIVPARETYRALGMESWEREAAELEQELGGAPHRPGVRA